MGYVIYYDCPSGKRYVDVDGCQTYDKTQAYVWNNVGDMLVKAYGLRDRWNTSYVFWERQDA